MCIRDRNVCAQGRLAHLSAAEERGSSGDSAARGARGLGGQGGQPITNRSGSGGARRGDRALR
eukprot:14176237-Alexandrium_andersonii.AAC.1